MLGSGGGGHTKILSGLVEQQLDRYGPASIILTEKIDEHCVVAPIAFIGAPLVLIEKIPSIISFEALLFQIKKDYPNKKIILMPAEIGGCNALTPLLLASKYQLPILDADLIGRAFPKMTMCKPAVLKYSPDPTYLADSHGHCITLHASIIEEIENSARNIVVDFGSSAAVSTFIFSGKNANSIDQYVIQNSFSRALTIGNTMLQYQKNPIEMIGVLSADLLAHGKINNIFYNVASGFLNGRVQIETNKKIMVEVFFQNEFLLVKKNNEMIAESPDVISLIDAKNGIPITAESLKYALEVMVLRMQAPDFWLNEEARAITSYHPDCGK